MPNALCRLVACFTILMVLVPSVGRAEDVEKQVSRMNKRAMEDFDSLEFESARRTMIDAIALLRSSGLDETPLAAQTYLNLGVIYIAGFKDRNRGIQQLVSALKLDPQLKVDPALATPEIDEAFGAAEKQAQASGAPIARPPVTPPPPTTPEAEGLQHVPIDEARPGRAIPVAAQLGGGTEATRVFVLYRASGQAEFTALPLRNVAGASWKGRIPAEAAGGGALQYYLEARDARGRPVVASGSAVNPYIIAMSESAPGAVAVEDGDTDRARRPVSKDRGGKKFHRLFIFVMPGFGFGYQPAGNVTEVAWQYQRPEDRYRPASVDPPGGIAVAPFHLAIELGGMITKHFSLSALGRFQFVTGANAQTVDTGMQQGATTKAFGAAAAMLRARYRFLDGRFHPYVHVDFGGGEIRHALDLGPAQSATTPLVDRYTADLYNSGDTGVVRQEVCSNRADCKDSISLGYLFLGGGAGLWYDVSSHVGLILDVNLLGALGVGGGQYGLNVDIQLGVGAHFL